jgi:hypothetical protein
VVVSGESATVKVTWDAVPTAQDYRLQYRVVGQDWSATGWGPQTSSDLTLRNGNYEFRVQARSEAGESDFSDVVSEVVKAEKVRDVKAPKSVKRGTKTRLAPKVKWVSKSRKTCTVTKRGKKVFVTGKTKGKCVLVSKVDGKKTRHTVRVK